MSLPPATLAKGDTDEPCRFSRAVVGSVGHDDGNDHRAPAGTLVDELSGPPRPVCSRQPSLAHRLRLAEDRGCGPVRVSWKSPPVSRHAAQVTIFALAVLGQSLGG